MDDSFESHPSNLITSTPRKPRPRRLIPDASSVDVSFDVSFSGLPEVAAPSDNRIFKVPNKPLKKKLKPTKVCTYCGKGYLCTSSFNTRVLNHKVQAAAQRYPKRKMIMENLPELGKSTLKRLSNDIASGERGDKYKQLVDDVKKIEGCEESNKWNSFLSELGEKLLDNDISCKFLLPYKLLGELRKQVDLVLTESSTDLLNTLSLPPVYDFNLQSAFLLSFILNFAEELLQFISFCVRSHNDNVWVRRIPDLDQDERETIYYVAGAILHGYRRIAKRYKNNSKWTAIDSALREKAITDEPVGDSSGTLAIDRGGLIYVTKECQDFFLALAKVVYSHEAKDGSIDYSGVIKAVSTSDVVVLWDRIFEESLSECLSLNFMNDVTERFCRVCGNGIAKKRLNNLRRGPVVSMPTRHLVATRKQK